MRLLAVFSKFSSFQVFKFSSLFVSYVRIRKGKWSLDECCVTFTRKTRLKLAQKDSSISSGFSGPTFNCFSTRVSLFLSLSLSLSLFHTHSHSLSLCLSSHQPFFDAIFLILKSESKQKRKLKKNIYYRERERERTIIQLKNKLPASYFDSYLTSK